MKSRSSQEPVGLTADHTLSSDHREDLNSIVNTQNNGPPRSFTHTILRLLAQILLPILVIILAFGVYWYMISTKPLPQPRSPQEIVFSVKSTKVVLANHQPYINLYGTTVAGRQVELRTLVAGKVEKTGPQLLAGGEVKAGDMLLKIDPFNYRIDVSEAEAQLAEAKAKLAETKASSQVEKGNLASAREQLRLAQTDLSRATKLKTQGTVAKRTVDDRQLVLLQRQQLVLQSENNLKVWLARKAQHEATVLRLETVLKRAEKRLAETILTAPFNAYVSDVGAQIGRMLSVNDRVATLIDRDWIDVRFSLTEGQFSRLAEGEKSLMNRSVQINWNVGRKRLTYAATIERIDARVEVESGGIQIYAKIKTPNDPVPVRPGIFVEVRLADKTFKNVAKVPSEAVYDSQSIYIIENGLLRKRDIEVVGTSGKDFLIKGHIQTGDRVMITRISRPGDGVRVKEVALNDV